MIADFLAGLAILLSIVTGGHYEPQLGAFSDPFVSIQLAPNPSNGDCLFTDGTENYWGSGCSGGGGGGAGNVSTSTGETAGQLAYWTSTNATPALLGKVATTTLTGGSQVAVSNSPVVIGSSGAALSIVADSIGDTQLAFNTGQNLTTASSPTFAGLTIGVDSIAEYISDTAGAMWTGNTETGGSIVYQDADNTLDFTCNTASGSVFGCLSTTDWTTFNGKESTLTFNWPLSRSTNTISWAGLATTSNPTAGNIFYSNGTNGLIPIATSSINVGTATALAANGANCSSGNAPLGVDASGAVESCFDVWTQAENTAAAYAAQATTITIAGTANQITSSAGAQDLSANRTWTLSYPTNVIFPNNASTTGDLEVGGDGAGNLDVNGTATFSFNNFIEQGNGGLWFDTFNNFRVGIARVSTSDPGIRLRVGNGLEAFYFASTTNFGIGTSSPYAKLSVVGDVVGARFVATTTTASAFPYASTTALSATSLCLTGDTCITSWPSGSGGLISYDAWTHPSAGVSATSSGLIVTAASSTFTQQINSANATSTLFTATTAWLTNLFIGADTIAEYISDTVGAMFSGNTETGVSVTYQDGDNTIDVICDTANGSTFGCLTSGDWTTFNGKESVLTFSYPLSRSANTISLAFGTTTSNIWSSTQTFSAIAGAIDAGGATSFEIPNSSSQSPTTAGQIALDTTSNQVKYGDGSNTKVLGNGYQYASFSYATSTAWTGTTTIPLGPAGVGETWSQVQCFTDAGTLQVSLYDGSNRMNFMNASTTVGIVGLTTNNTFTLSEKRYADVGTPASSPTKISCTVRKEISAD